MSALLIVLRAETAAASLKSAGETVSDSFLIAMVLKGLPTEYFFSDRVAARQERRQDEVSTDNLRSH